MLTLGFVWSGSRGGFIALVAVVGLHPPAVLRDSLRWRVSATALVAVDSAARRPAISTGSRWRRSPRTPTTTTRRRPDGCRSGAAASATCWQNPVLGVGPGNFPDRRRHAVAAGGAAAVRHRRPLERAAQQLRADRRRARHSGPRALSSPCIASAVSALRAARAALTPALTASLLGFVVGSFFLSLAYSEMLYTLVAFARSQVTACRRCRCATSPS